MAVTTFAAIDVGSYELEMKIFEISQKNKVIYGNMCETCYNDFHFLQRNYKRSTAIFE